MRGYRFRFDQAFRPYDADRLLKDFFKDVNVLQTIQVLTTVRGSEASLATGAKDTIGKIDSEPVECSATSMAFFDRLYDCGALRENGEINGCIPEWVNGYAINQELNKIMLLEDSDNYDTFSEEDRGQFLFRIFKHLTLGGPLNQYEDNIGPYFDTVKKIYKDFVSVSRDPATKAIVVNSSVFKISAVEGLMQLFPIEEHFQNFMYVAIDPAKRQVTVWYNAWCGDA